MRKIEDYALIGDMRCAALVGRDGSIDWFCPPRFDAPACFAALLGGAEHGHWRVAPLGEVLQQDRAYLPDTLVLNTEWRTAGGRVRVRDCMPLGEQSCILRVIECLEGALDMQMSLLPRFGNGARTARLQLGQEGLSAWDGEQRLLLRGELPLQLEEGCAQATFRLQAGEVLTLELFHLAPGQWPAADSDPLAAMRQCHDWWRRWVGQCSYRGRWREAVVRSLITLKALTYAPSGGMVAAPTTSLPELPGGAANWDYRFCWVRDAVLALDILIDSNYLDEARAWHAWLHRALDGEGGKLRVLYDVEAGPPVEEKVLEWLPGFLDSRPVRIGNAASNQHQLDLRGQLLDLLHILRRSGLQPCGETWERQCELMEELARRWREPDDGIWELRDRRRNYTHSKIYAWVAVDRSIRDAETFSLRAPLECWRTLRDEIHADICAKGVDPQRGAFRQSYEESRPDASLLMAPLLGFLPIEDERVQATLRGVEQSLFRDGLVWRFAPEQAADGDEGAFLACSFWLVDNWVMAGRETEAEALFERLLRLRNDVGLLAEQYQPGVGQLGNFPQALSHLALVKSAYLLEACEQVHRGGVPERHSYGPVEDA